MSKLSHDEFMKSLKTILGDRTDDEAIKFIEDAEDTITESKDDEWKTKYENLLTEKEELDKTWRKRYSDRFFNSDTSHNDDDKNHEQNKKTNPATPKDDELTEEEKQAEQAEKIRIDDLFKPAD